MKLFIVVVGIFLTACTSLPDVKKIPKKNLTHEIHFVYEKWHTSIIIPAASVEKHSRYFNEIAKQKQYIRFGYGDGDFFTGKNKSFFSGAKALVASDYSAVQVLDYYSNPLEEIPEETRVPLFISEKRMKKLIRYMDKSIALNKKRLPISLKAYEENTGYFFKAKQGYSMFSNCNTWSSQALHAAGISIKTRFNLTAQSVFEQAKYISDYQQEFCRLDSVPNTVTGN
jgi:uncharacterized protein (TIGR02117 family)